MWPQDLHESHRLNGLASFNFWQRPNSTKHVHIAWRRSSVLFSHQLRNHGDRRVVPIGWHCVGIGGARKRLRRGLCMHDVPMSQAHLADQRRIAQQLAAAHKQAQHLRGEVAAPLRGQLQKKKQSDNSVFMMCFGAVACVAAERERGSSQRDCQLKRKVRECAKICSPTLTSA